MNEKPRVSKSARVLVGVLLGGMFIWAAWVTGGNGGFDTLRRSAWAIFIGGPIFQLGLGVVLWMERFRYWAATSAAVGIAIAGVGYWSFFVEPTRLETTTHRLEIEGLTKPVTIAVLADFQADAIGPYEKRVLQTLGAIDADLVVSSGDHLQAVAPVDYDPIAADFRDAWRAAEISAPLGVFAVGGNTDPPWWPNFFSGLDVRCTVTTSYTTLREDLELVTLSEQDSQHGTKLHDSDRVRIVVGHYPDYVKRVTDADVLIAGHTHGGQVQIPGIGPIITLSRVPRAWAAGGAHAVDGRRTLIVSRGTGMERGDAPRLRFNCPPQLVVIELVPTGE